MGMQKQWAKCFSSDSIMDTSASCVFLTLSIAMALFVLFVVVKRWQSDLYKNDDGTYKNTFFDDLKVELGNGIMVFVLALLASPTVGTLVNKMWQKSGAKVASPSSDPSAGRYSGHFLETSW